MANYNTFIVIESKHGKVLLVTSSARKANSMLCVGKRIEVWNGNQKAASITNRTKKKMSAYIQNEKEYIRQKQENSTTKNLSKKGAKRRNETRLLSR